MFVLEILDNKCFCQKLIALTMLAILFIVIPRCAVGQYDKDQGYLIPPTSKLLNSYLKLTAFRHKILSHNVSNINTPGYKAKEVATPQKPEDLLNISKPRRLRLVTTSSKHFTGIDSQDNNFAVEKLKNPDELKPNGNDVSLSQQLTKLSQNQINYDTSLQAYKSSNGLVSSILGK